MAACLISFIYTLFILIPYETSDDPAMAKQWKFKFIVCYDIKSYKVIYINANYVFKCIYYFVPLGTSEMFLSSTA